MAVQEEDVAEWVSALDGARVRQILVALNRFDLPTAERVLGNALDRPISLDDAVLRESLLDALELRIAPDYESEDSDTGHFPRTPIPERDVRDEEATDEVDRVRRIIQ
jgi:hypothetical protein